ncbi:MAG: hypothetical protein HYS12_29225 [Planctomycetes bacterium]|nr:hypothetical protein [Planctomycetota bacterium]
MRRMKYLCWLPAALAVLWASCAPVDSPGRRPEPTEEDQPPEPVTKPLPPVRGGLRERVEAAMRQVWSRELRTDNGFWTVFHAILGMGFETTLADPLTGKTVNAIEHIRAGGTIRGMEFIPTKNGLDVRTGPQFVGQGHQDQFVAEMTQWGITADKTWRVYGKDYPFLDFARHSKLRASVTSDQELSWAIIMIAEFFSTDLNWTNEKGEKLTFGDVVHYELNQPIEENAACGGTHRLFGLTWAYFRHLERGGKTVGVWKDVDAALSRYADRARKYQNPDGTFSTSYLAGPGNLHDVQLRIGTTGHVLEWLAFALPAARLREQWVQDAAGALSLLILDNQNRGIESGALYHATHGLHIYHDRVFGPMPDRRAPVLPLRPGEEIPKYEGAAVRGK